MSSTPSLTLYFPFIVWLWELNSITCYGSLNASLFISSPLPCYYSPNLASAVHGAKRLCAMDFIPWVIKQHYVSGEFGLIVKLRQKPLSSSAFSPRERFPERGAFCAWHRLMWHNAFCGSFCDRYVVRHNAAVIFLLLPFFWEDIKHFMHFRCNCAVRIAVSLMLFHHRDITIRK